MDAGLYGLRGPIQFGTGMPTIQTRSWNQPVVVASSSGEVGWGGQSVQGVAHGHPGGRIRHERHVATDRSAHRNGLTDLGAQSAGLPVGTVPLRLKQRAARMRADRRRDGRQIDANGNEKHSKTNLRNAKIGRVERPPNQPVLGSDPAQRAQASQVGGRILVRPRRTRGVYELAFDVLKVLYRT